MSFTSYPILSFGSNTDVVRQGHNLLTTNIGDMNGLQTIANETIVDALNYLNSAIAAIVVSAYPPLNNEQWLTATTASGGGTLNLFKLSSANEFIIGQHVIPLSTLTDLGKSVTAWRAGYITTVHTTKIKAVTNLEIQTDTTLTLTLANSSLILTEVSSTALKLETALENLDIKSVQTRLFSGNFLWDITTSGHLEPGVTQTQNIGSASKEVNRVFTKNITVSGDATINGDIIAPNAGAAVPIGGSCIWFMPTIPANYFIANGQAISRVTYSTLFGIYGTTFGTGDGSTTFNLPDMRNRIPFGVNTSQTSNPDASVPGRTFGALNHTHNTTMPKHYHTSTGLGISDHTSQVTGTPSVLPSASFSGNPLSNHGHSVTQSDHSHNSTQSGHSHGSGSYGLTSDGAHRHDIANRSGNANIGDPAVLSLVRGGANNEGGSTGNTLAGSFDGGHTHGFGGRSSTEVIELTIFGAQAQISIDQSSAGTPSGNVSLSNTSHTHTIPTLTHNISGTVGITAGGANGDVDQTLASTTNNPPCFAVHFIIRAR